MARYRATNIVATLLGAILSSSSALAHQDANPEPWAYRPAMLEPTTLAFPGRYHAPERAGPKPSPANPIP